MESGPRGTRIWWDNEEVHFVGWTDRALVFHWEDPRETAIHMPRGAVVRLIDKGVLRIEGYIPTWMQVEKPAPPSTPVEPPAPANSKLSIVQRLIRKLSGDRNPNPGPVRAAQG